MICGTDFGYFVASFGLFDTSTSIVPTFLFVIYDNILAGRGALLYTLGIETHIQPTTWIALLPRDSRSMGFL